MSDAPATPHSFVRFPPGWGTALVPVGPRRTSAQATALYTASKRGPLFAQRVLWAAARVAGSSLLPGRRETFSPPMAEETFLGLYRDWCRAVGNGVEGFAVHRRLQPSRQALVLLLCAGDRSLLIRVRRDPAELHKERRISEAAGRLNTRTFRVPQLRADGERDGWNWTGYEVISRRPHAPARSTPPELFDEITELVEAVIPRPPAAPQSWRGCHGDLTPWNLRRAHRTTWLIDWEDAAYAPPGADRVYFAATASAIGRAEPRGPLPVTENEADAVRYWRDVLQHRETVEREARLSRRLAMLLG